MDEKQLNYQRNYRATLPLKKKKEQFVKKRLSEHKRYHMMSPKQKKRYNERTKNRMKKLRETKRDEYNKKQRVRNLAIRKITLAKQESLLN